MQIDNRCILISIQPKWCELIAEGKKTVEVRKTIPNLETPFKVYIYCTKNGKNLIKGDVSTTIDFVAVNGGKVIGEFVCDTIETLTERDLFEGMDEISHSRIEEYSCVDIDGLLQYKGSKNEIYGWHISDLVIYDEPRELSEFRTPDWYRDCEKQCDDMERMRCPVKDSRKADKMSGWCRKAGKKITRPFQSWGYVEGEDAK